MQKKQTALFVWGFGENAQLGNNQSKSIPIPYRIKELDRQSVVLVSTGNYFTLALTSSGQVFGWGSAKHQRFGLDGDIIKSPTQIKQLSGIRGISAGNWHSVAVNQKGECFAAGHNNYGALGTGNLQKQKGFVKVQKVMDIVSVSAGDGFTLFLNNSNSLFSCGHKAKNGLGSDAHQSTPKLLLQNISSMNAGYTHAAAVTIQQKVFVWGDNSYLQLGFGSGLKSVSKPKILQSLQGQKVVEVTCSRGQKHAHSAAVTAEGRVFTWGCGYKGKLGHYKQWTHQDPADQPYPKQLKSIEVGFSRVIPGGIHTCLLSKEGEVYSCGCGSDGRLGHPQSEKYTYLYREGIPKLVQSLKGWKVISLSCSYYHNALIAQKI